LGGVEDILGEHFAEPDDGGAEEAAAMAVGGMGGERHGVVVALLVAVEAAPGEEGAVELLDIF
jgi:hypothetical protein